MKAFSIIVAIVDIILCIALILLVVTQEGEDRGMGALSGSNNMDTFFSKNSTRGREQAKKRLTTVLGIAFGLVTLLLYGLVSR